MNVNLKSIEELLVQELNLSQKHLLREGGGYQNLIFRYDSDDDQYIIRVTSEFHRTKELLLGEIEFINHLSQNKIPVSKVLLFDDDSCIKTVKLNHIKYYVMKFELVKGLTISDWTKNTFQLNLFETWGKLVGKMHRLTKNITPIHERVEWIHDRKYINKIEEHLENQDTIIRQNFFKLMNTIATLPIQRETYGLIHNDLHQGNFFVENQTIHLFDFDDCAYNWFAYDIAVSFYHATWTGLSFNPEWKSLPNDFLDYFLRGYATENYLHHDILKQVPLFLRLREFFLYGLFLKNWDRNNLLEWQIEKLKELRDNLLNEKVPYIDLVPYSQYQKSYNY